MHPGGQAAGRHPKTAKVAPHVVKPLTGDVTNKARVARSESRPTIFSRRGMLSVQSPRLRSTTTTPMPSLRRLAILAAILIVYVFQVERVHPVVFFGQFQDDSIYFSTAKALANGPGYNLISFPGSPPQTKYPIVYPWLLSFIWKLNPNFPANLVPAIRLTEFFGCVSLLAMLYLFRKLPGIGETPALFLTAVCAVQPVFVRTSFFVMSDVPFMAFLLTALALCVVVESDRGPAWMYALIGGIAGTSVGVRTVGVALVAGIFCALAYVAFISKKSFRTAIIFLASSIFAMAMVMAPALLHSGGGVTFENPSEPGWNQVAAYYTSYTRFQWGMGVPSLGALAQLFLANLFVWAWSPGPILIGTFPGIFGKIVFLAAMALSFLIWIGLLRLSRSSEWRPVGLVTLFYTCAVLVWPYPQPERFLLPFLPVLLAALWCEARRIGGDLLKAIRGGSSLMRRLLAVTVAAIFFFLLASAAWNYVVLDPRARQMGAALRDATVEQRRQGYQWMREHTAPGDRVAAWQDAVLYLYAGRQSVRPIAALPQATYAFDQESLKRDLDHICDAPRHIGAHYWLTAPDDFSLETRREQFLARMAQVAAVLPMVFQSSDGSVQIHDSSCLNDAQRADCQAAQSVLFPR